MTPAAAWRRRLGLEGRAASLASALFVYGFGEELWSRYLPEYLRVLGASALAVGAFGALRDFLDAAYAYPGGALTDRLGSAKSLTVFGALTAAGILVYLAWPSIAGVFVGLLLVRAWASLGLPATFAMIGEELPSGRRIVGFTAQAIVKRIPIVVAPPLGGLLLERMGMRQGMRAGFAISAVLAIFMLFPLRRGARERPSPQPAEVSGGKPPDPPRAGRGRRLPAPLRQLLIADCLVRLCEGLPDVFLVIWAIEVVRITPVQFGLLTSVMTASAVLSYFPAAVLAERAEKKPFVLATYVFFTLFPLAVFLSRSFPVLLIAYVVGGLREIGEPARKSLILDLSEPSARGRTVGLYYTIRGFAVAGAAAIGGALWTIGPAWTFLAAAALGLLGTAWTAVFLRTGIASSTGGEP
ncbi:MAG TPA: MFS transporter [Thermoanaerobaculia bacterium]|nr:MFS transporter [Thermoanaerobaculia bacterium]